MSEANEPSLCSHRKRVKTEDVIVCTECGVVIEQDALIESVINEREDRDHLWTELSHTQRVMIQTPDYSNKVLHELIRSICARFALPTSICERSIELVNKIVASKLVNRGRTGRRAAASVIYLLSRSTEQKYPLLLSDLAALLGELPSVLFSSVSQVKPFVLRVFPNLQNSPFDPSLYVERQVNSIYAAISSNIDRRQLTLASHELCNISQEHSLVEGRKGEAICLAAIIVSLESEGMFMGQKPRDLKAKMKQICKIAEISDDTVFLRINELKDALIKEAQSVPLLRDQQELLKKDKIACSINDIIRHRQYTGATVHTAPPAFVASSERRQDRLQQISKAQTRIDKPPAEGYLENLSIEDLIVERLLLRGIQEERIIQATTAKSLYALESEVFFEDLEDSDVD